MASVDPLFAQWLQAEANFVVREDASAVQRWGTTAKVTERVTGIATRAAAVIEAEREIAFFAHGPFAIEVHQLLGTDWAEQLLRVVTITIDELGYDAGIDVLVLEAEVERSTGMSVVTVLRPLRGLS